MFIDVTMNMDVSFTDWLKNTECCVNSAFEL